MSKTFYFPKEIFRQIYDFIRPIPTLQTRKNWRNSKPRFDINELKCGYIPSYNDEHVYRRKIIKCNLHNFDSIMNDPTNACNCTNSHIVRTYCKPCLIWNDNYLALWKSTPKGNKLIWHYVDIIDCDSCGDLHIAYHIRIIEGRNICKWCFEVDGDGNLY